jgi:uncharacterized membrane protein YfhO
LEEVIEMKIYLILISVVLLVLSAWFFPFIIFLPYAALNLVFVFRRETPRWLRLTLQVASLALALLASILAVLCISLNASDLMLGVLSIPLALLAVHGFIEFCYMAGFPSRKGSRARVNSE